MTLCAEARNLQAPSTKTQAPEKLQSPSFKSQSAARRQLNIGAWSFFGVWSLGFGALVLFAYVLAGHDAVFDSVNVKHHAEPPERQQ